MKSSTLISLAVGGSLVPALFVKRDYNEMEHLVLSDCGIGSDGASKSRQIMYYSGNPWDGENDWIRPDMMVNVPWDGSYPWRTTGTSVKMPNADIFTVTIDPAIPDYNVDNTRLAGKVSHTYDKHDLDCYASHQSDVYTLDDGTKCSSAYICNHFMVDDPPKEDPPKKDPPKSIRKTKVSFSSRTVEVEQKVDARTKEKFTLIDPYDAFHNIFDDINGPQCNSYPYPIGDSCTIKFDDCNFVDPEGYAENSTANALGSLLTESTGREISKNVTNWRSNFYTGKYSGSYNNRKFTYPQNGQVTIYTALSETPESITPQSWLHYEIECEKSSFCGKACQGVASAAFAVGSHPEFPWVNLLGVIISGVCTQCS
ncbi:hypothetical protein XANCAGTX0491_001387 [Xanthoria calcicola]